MDEYDAIEIKRVCRVCLIQKEHLRPLFEGSLANMLKDIASVQVSW